jgi:hypothetical protein
MTDDFLPDIESEALEGGWKSLCVGVLLQGVQRMEASSKLFKPGSRHKIEGNGGADKELLHQRTQARAWLEGGVGAITFEDCCNAMGVDPERTRRKIVDWCHSRKRKPRKTWDFSDSSLTS